MVAECGTFRGYYYTRVDDFADVVAEASAACVFLSASDGLDEERCQSMLVKVERNRSTTYARCKREDNGTCALERVC